MQEVREKPQDLDEKLVAEGDTNMCTQSFHDSEGKTKVEESYMLRHYMQSVGDDPWHPKPNQASRKDVEQVK